METKIILILVLLIAFWFYYGEAEGELPCPLDGMSKSICIYIINEETSYNKDVQYEIDYIC